MIQWSRLSAPNAGAQVSPLLEKRDPTLQLDLKKRASLLPPAAFPGIWGRAGGRGWKTGRPEWLILIQRQEEPVM